MKTEDLLIKLELSLHSATVRASKEELELLLSENFLEIGASGEVYRRKEIIKRLPNDISPEIYTTDFEFRELSPGVVQLIYKSKSKLRSNDTRHAIRNSIWRLEGRQWRILFHQGTMTKSGE